MSIWRKTESIEKVNQLRTDTLAGHLGIRVTEIGADFIRATMPVDERTRQPMGILHGGASVALAESAGSLGAYLAIGPGSRCVGVEINANHLRSVSKGLVTATARPVHIGGRTHVWEIRITDAQDRLVCISRLTMAIIRCDTGQELEGDALPDRAIADAHPVCQPVMPAESGSRPPVPTDR